MNLKLEGTISNVTFKEGNGPFPGGGIPERGRGDGPIFLNFMGLWQIDQYESI